MRKIIFLLVVIFSMTSSAKTVTHSHDLITSINHTLKNFDENINIGIVVENLQDRRILYYKNGDRYFSPASNQKLFTAWAALHYLGENFTYKTPVFFDIAKIKNNVLQDNLYIKFNGDPTLTIDALDDLINSIAVKDVQRIAGNIVIDDTAFDNKPLSPGTSWDDAEACFGSPINSIIINHNCISAKLQPGVKVGDKAILTLPTYPQSLQFINEVFTADANVDKCNFEITKQDSKTYLIAGCIKQDAQPQDIATAIFNPRENLEFVLRYLFQKHQIAINNFVYAPIPNNVILFQEIPSAPLSNLITTMLKDSDNTIANALYKTIGAHFANAQGTWENGKTAMQALMTKTVSTDISEKSLMGGAGLSRYLSHTPIQLLTLFHKFYFSPYKNILLTSLPIAGIDGTLKDRMQSPQIKGKVRAKTGTMTGVSTLTGVIETKHHHLVAFSIMNNSFGSDDEKYKLLEDKICEDISRF